MLVCHEIARLVQKRYSRSGGVAEFGAHLQAPVMAQFVWAASLRVCLDHLGRIAERDDPSFFEKHDPVAQFLDRGQIVRHEQDRAAALVKAADSLLASLAERGIP